MMKDFWMVVQTYPDVPGSYPMVMGAPHTSFDDACDKAIRIHRDVGRCPVVVMQSVAIAGSDAIPDITEAKPKEEQVVPRTIDAAQRAILMSSITEWHRKEFSKWAKANGIAEQCGMTDDELLESVEFTIREPVKCDYCYVRGLRGHTQR